MNATPRRICYNQPVTSTEQRSAVPSGQDFAIVDRGGLNSARLAQIDEIFFEASGRTFLPGRERDAFHERWLGRYLRDPEDVVLLALGTSKNVVGYLVGALEDPAGQHRFSDISYFREDFRDLCRLYPAHFHINVAAAFQSRETGAGLITAFARRAARAGAPGMHVVTGKGARNVAFYRRCNFEELRGAVWNGNNVVFLGRRLT
jgi:GNAT superfamily N-acetyltransferase